jgi:hypothetical protein
MEGQIINWNAIWNVGFNVKTMIPLMACTHSSDYWMFN